MVYVASSFAFSHIFLKETVYIQVLNIHIPCLALLHLADLVLLDHPSQDPLQAGADALAQCQAAEDPLHSPGGHNIRKMINYRYSTSRF